MVLRWECAACCCGSLHVNGKYGCAVEGCQSEYRSRMRVDVPLLYTDTMAVLEMFGVQEKLTSGGHAVCGSQQVPRPRKRKSIVISQVLQSTHQFVKHSSSTWTDHNLSSCSALTTGYKVASESSVY